jgi:hypothetical protein
MNTIPGSIDGSHCRRGCYTVVQSIFSLLFLDSPKCSRTQPMISTPPTHCPQSFPKVLPRKCVMITCDCQLDWTKKYLGDS